MHGEPLLIIVVLVFGIGAFLFGVIYVVCSILSAIGRGMMGIVRPHRRTGTAELDGTLSRPLVCPRRTCRKVEHRGDARFCGQCGAELAVGRLRSRY